MEQLKVWWKPQIPCDSFEVPVANLEEAKILLRTLAAYDIWQFEHRIKPDFANAGGLVRWEEADGYNDAGWYDWYDDEGHDIDDLLRAERSIAP